MFGRFALVGLPYTAKFLWSPFLDSVPPPFWGRRRGWAFLLQMLLVGAIAAMTLVDPKTQLGELSLIALVLAFVSASQDIVVDAFRVESLPDNEQAAGMAAYGASKAALDAFTGCAARNTSSSTRSGGMPCTRA